MPGQAMTQALRQAVRRNFYSKVENYLAKFIPDDSVVYEVRTSQRSNEVHSKRHWCLLTPNALPIRRPPDDQRQCAIVLNLCLDEQHDVQAVLESWNQTMRTEDRLYVVTYNRIWIPAIWFLELMGLRERPDTQNYIPWDQLENLLALSGFEVVRRTDALLFPLGPRWMVGWLNRWLSPLPILRSLAAVRVTCARKFARDDITLRSASIIVPARNESGNIRPLLERLPRFREQLEVIFVEGNSKDDTWEEIGRCMSDTNLTRGLHVLAFQQPGIGKGDAVREGMSRARMDVVGILDADLSVPPEELPKYFDALDRGVLEFANGSRLMYSMQDQAMRLLNLIGNKVFAASFSFLIGQRVRDTLCGTKVLTRENWERISAGRSFFGDLDPFGDFDLLLGATRLSLKIGDVPIHYQARTYGTTNISRFTHGWLLCRMSVLAASKIKFL
jgi:hypothetical protein